MALIRVVDARDWRADSDVMLAHVSRTGRWEPCSALIWAARAAVERDRPLVVVREWVPWARRAAALFGAAYLPPACVDQSIGLGYVVDDPAHLVQNLRASYPSLQVGGLVVVSRRSGDWRVSGAGAHLVAVEDLACAGGFTAAHDTGIPFVRVAPNWRPGQIDEVTVVVDRLRDLPGATRFAAEHRPPAVREIRVTVAAAGIPTDVVEADLFDQLRLARRLYPALGTPPARLTGHALGRELPKLGPRTMLVLTGLRRDHRRSALLPLRLQRSAHRHAAAIALLPASD